MENSVKSGLIKNLSISLIIIIILLIAWAVYNGQNSYGFGLTGAWERIAVAMLLLFILPCALFFSSIICLIICRKYPKAMAPNIIILIISIFILAIILTMLR